MCSRRHLVLRQTLFKIYYLHSTTNLLQTIFKIYYLDCGWRIAYYMVKWLNVQSLPWWWNSTKWPNPHGTHCARWKLCRQLVVIWKPGLHLWLIINDILSDTSIYCVVYVNALLNHLQPATWTFLLNYDIFFPRYKAPVYHLLWK